MLPAFVSFSLALAVCLGAFGAHGLRAVLDPYSLKVWETATLYFLMMMVALLAIISPHLDRPQLFWLGVYSIFGGTYIFSGSLYLLAVTGIKWLGAITPLGGLGIIIGWILIGIYNLKARL